MDNSAQSAYRGLIITKRRKVLVDNRRIEDIMSGETNLYKAASSHRRDENILRRAARNVRGAYDNEPHSITLREFSRIIFSQAATCSRPQRVDRLH